MELWQWIDQNYNSIIEGFVFASFLAGFYIHICNKEIKELKKQLEERRKLIDEMDKFIQNNSRVWH